MQINDHCFSFAHSYWLCVHYDCMGADFYFWQMSARTHLRRTVNHPVDHDQRVRHQRVQRALCYSIAIAVSAWDGCLIWPWVLSPGDIERSIQWILQKSVLAIHAGSACSGGVY